VSSGDVGAEARKRACISLTRRASEVWSTFSKAEKVRVASIFSELVLYYARTRRMPVASIDIVLQAADVVKEAYEICLKEKGELEKAVARFRGEVEELREKVSALGVLSRGSRQRLRSLGGGLPRRRSRSNSLRRRTTGCPGRLKRSGGGFQGLGSYAGSTQSSPGWLGASGKGLSWMCCARRLRLGEPALPYAVCCRWLACTVLPGCDAVFLLLI
jgi:hypothetical protein